MLEAAWYSLFVGLFGWILYCYSIQLKGAGIENKKLIKRVMTVVLIATAWFSYISILSNNGILSDLSIPPRFPLLVVAPLFIFIAIFLYKNRNSKILHSIPMHVPILYLAFRSIIEILFYFTYLQAYFPIEVTFEGYNFDVVIGLSAPIIAYLVYKSKISPRLIIAWNLLGMFLLSVAVFIFVSCFYLPSFWSKTEPLLSSDFVTFPFVLLPAFFMPSAMFVHVLSIIQARKMLK